MALTEFVIPPNKAGYSVKDGNEVVATSLAGGASRYRRDILNSTSRVTANWSVGPDEYRYIRSFYRGVTVSGSTPFMIDLILDESYLTSHKAYFVPNTMATTGQSGLTYYVSAELEVYPAPVSEYAVDYVGIYNEFGKNFRRMEDILNTIVNVSLPEVF